MVVLNLEIEAAAGRKRFPIAEITRGFGPRTLFVGPRDSESFLLREVVPDLTDDGIAFCGFRELNDAESEELPEIGETFEFVRITWEKAIGRDA